MPGLSDYALRSDFLVYWTGKDLDKDFDADWDNDHSKPNRMRDQNGVIALAYLRRLKDILKYGLWLTQEREWIELEGNRVDLPTIPRVCFTELKLSESRRHARRYGRLGIGVKRPFVFFRQGRPLSYFGFGKNSKRDPFLKACVTDLKDKTLLNFFKPMNSTSKLNYDLYDEAEWRILFFESMLASRQLIDPRDPANAEAHNYFKSLALKDQDKLKYLAPLDGWLSLIIYPTHGIKSAAQHDVTTGIKDEIERIKTTPDHAHSVEGKNWPTEIDLNACRHL